MSVFQGTLEDSKANDPFLRARHGHSGAGPEKGHRQTIPRAERNINNHPIILNNKHATQTAGKNKFISRRSVQIH